MGVCFNPSVICLRDSLMGLVIGISWVFDDLEYRTLIGSLGRVLAYIGRVDLSMVLFPCGVVTAGLFRFASLPARNLARLERKRTFCPPVVSMHKPARPDSIRLGDVLGFSLEIIFTKHLTTNRGGAENVNHQVIMLYVICLLTNC